jgi:hypothetical protein
MPYHTDGGQEAFVQSEGGRRHVVEVQEHASRAQQPVRLRVDLSFALVAAVVDGQARHHGVEGPEGR